jgi:hypothetical protein
LAPDLCKSLGVNGRQKSDTRRRPRPLEEYFSSSNSEAAELALHRVRNKHLEHTHRCPLFPRKRTSSECIEMSVKGQKRLFRLRADRIAVTTRQGDDKLGKCAGLGLHVDPAAMLLQAGPRAFPGRLSSEEGTRRPERRRVAGVEHRTPGHCPALSALHRSLSERLLGQAKSLRKSGMPR